MPKKKKTFSKKASRSLLRAKNKEKRMKLYRRESVACVRNQHTGFSDGTIADGDTLYKPRSTHLRRKFHKLKPFFTCSSNPSHSQESKHNLFLLKKKKP